MRAYIPFLIPLTDADPDETGPILDRIGSPIEEEEQLEQLGEVATDWKELETRCRRTYGLPLLWSIEDALDCRPVESLAGAASPRRALVARDGETTWFILEHPASMDLYDRLATGGEQPILARPSLFTRLWRDGRIDERAPEATAPRDGPSTAEALSRELESILRSAKPSDWHLEPAREGYTSRLRIDGTLTTGGPLSRGKGEWLVRAFTAAAGLKPLFEDAREGRVETRVQGMALSLRLSFIPTLYGPALVVRFLYPDEAESFQLETIGLQADTLETLRNAYSERDGLWLLAGPTGSGKSTTLHSLLRTSVARGEKVLAVEDPVEMTIDGVHHLGIGSPPGLTYAVAVKAFLRQSPDCLLIGEIRDPETAAIAIQAARTGHRVLSTLHARNDAGLLRRFGDLGQDADSLRSVVRMVLHQRLVPLLCPECRTSRAFPVGWVEPVREAGLAAPETLATSAGCPRCHEGHAGRRALFAEGRLDYPEFSDTGLLQAAWALFSQQRISLRNLLPFLTPALRRHFQICQP